MATKLRLARANWSVRSYLIALAICCTLPVTIAAGFLALDFVGATAERERSLVENRLYLLRDAVDQRIELAVRVLESLATSPSLQTGDFDAFRVSAAETARSLGVLVIVLSDETGRQLVNTRAPSSEPIPTRAHLEAQNRVFATGEPQVSDLYQATLDQRPVITVEVPVRVAGKIRYVLSMGVEPRYLSTLMQDYVPPGFIGSIIDRNGILIARQGTPQESDLIGKPTIPEVLAHLNEPKAFWIKAISRAGVPTFTSILHSQAGWAINLAVPRSLIEGPFRQATTFVIAIAAIALTVSLLLASLVARRLSGSAVLLEDAAERIGSEQQVIAVPTKVREYDRALAAFAGASNQISLRAAERDRAEAALRESELRWRSIAETLPNLVWTCSPDGQCDWLSSQWGKYTGIAEEHLLGLKWLEEVIHPDDRERTRASWQAACEGRAEYDLEYRIRRYDGEYRWFKTRGVPLKDDTGKIVYWFGTCTDIEDIRSAEQREQMLMREVNHRAKNILALVQAIARQTAFNSPQEFIERFDERLRALAANQDLLVKSGWKEISLDTLVRTQLAHFDDILDRRITISGPPLHLNAAAAQTLGIILHELSTNATKYGALSCAAGRVAMSWAIENVSDAKPRLRLCWTETGGPRVVSPTRRGFGSTVLEAYAKMSLKADVSLVYALSGLSWRMECPIDRVIETRQSGDPFAFADDSPSPEMPAPKKSRVLVVEDDALGAIEVASLLQNSGYLVIGPAGTVEEASQLLADNGGCDAALLDVNLGKETSESIANQLFARNIPFIAMSGYSKEQLPLAFKTAPFVSKPLQHHRLLDELHRSLSGKVVSLPQRRKSRADL